MDVLRSEVWVRGLYHVFCNYVPLEENIGPHPVAIQTLLSVRGETYKPTVGRDSRRWGVLSPEIFLVLINPQKNLLFIE